MCVCVCACACVQQTNQAIKILVHQSLLVLCSEYQQGTKKEENQMNNAVSYARITTELIVFTINYYIIYIYMYIQIINKPIEMTSFNKQ